MSERYVRPTVGGWLRPALIGPWISTYTTVSLYAAFAPAGYLPRWATWAFLMAAGTVFAGAYMTMLLLVDMALLAIRQRILPTGGAAWKMSLLSPAVVLVTYLVVRPHTFWKYGVWGVAGALLIPMLLGALATRVVGGQRVQAKR